MLDVLGLISVLAFFALGLAYTKGCDRLKGNKS